MGVRQRQFFTGGLLVVVAAGLVAAVAGWPAPAGAKQGTVIPRDGKPYTGDVTQDDRHVYVNVHGVPVTLDKRNVERIDYADDVDKLYAQRHAALSVSDVKGRVALSHWAADHGRPDLAISTLEEARRIDPSDGTVARELDDAQRQADLDRRQGHGGSATRRSAATAVAATTQPGPTAPEHRLLTLAEVNVVRQLEMRTNDRLVEVKLENNVARRYVAAAYGTTKAKAVAAFNSQPGEAQALEILRAGDPDLSKDVHILTDPTPIHLFKTKVMPVIAQGCGSPACHGGTHAGDFVLYSGESTQAIYTNFYILMTYRAQVGGVQYRPLDREVPDRSLALQFGLPALAGRPPHPQVKDWRPRFQGTDDPAYVTIDDWLNYSLGAIQPQYGFNVSPRLMSGATPAATMAASTRTATTPTTAAAGEPAHGTPLPRVSPGGPVTLPVGP